MSIPLSQLLAHTLSQPLPANQAAVPVTDLAYNSKLVREGAAFFAIPGAVADGRAFAVSAAEKGASAIIAEAGPTADFAASPFSSRIPWIVVPRTRVALATAAKVFLGAPDEALSIVGITGTNGKTTTAYACDGIFRAAGKKTSLLGTVGYHVLGETRTANNTTPESLELFRIFAETRQGGGTHVSMEVSSHALDQQRTHGIRFAAALFTNITQDHLDYHRTFAAYWQAKARLFSDEYAPGLAVINADDPQVATLQVSSRTTVLRYGLHSATADIRAEQVQVGYDGLQFTLCLGSQRLPVRSALTGEINVYNLMAAAGAAWGLGLSAEGIVAGIAALPGVPGRFERVDEGQPFLVVVDYAHTDDALANTLRIARHLLAGRQGRILTLFGCGGDRDRTKRPKMGAAAAAGSHFVMLTSDNPRSEEPADILNDIVVGLQKLDTPYAMEVDRATAIDKLLADARPGDIVILAGKGHETYQVLKDRTIAFDDREVARKTLRRLGYAKSAASSGKGVV